MQCSRIRLVLVKNMFTCIRDYVITSVILLFGGETNFNVIGKYNLRVNVKKPTIRVR